MYGVQGIYTDDTQYCLCGLQSIFETGHFDPERTTEGARTRHTGLHYFFLPTFADRVRWCSVQPPAHVQGLGHREKLRSVSRHGPIGEVRWRYSIGRPPDPRVLIFVLGRKAITRMVNGEDWHATGQFTAGTPSSPRVPIGQ